MGTKTEIGTSRRAPLTDRRKPCFKRFNKHCIPRTLVATLSRLRHICARTGTSPRFRGRLTQLGRRCIKHPSPLARTPHFTRELRRGANLSTHIFLGHRSLGRANTRGVGGTLKRTLLIGHVNGAHIVTRANTNRRNITATAIYTVLKLGYHVCVKRVSTHHRTLGITHVHVLNTRIIRIALNSHVLGSTVGRTLHS